MPNPAFDSRAIEAICSFSQANRSFALLLTKKERFARKTDEQIPNPGKGFPRLHKKSPLGGGEMVSQTAQVH